MTDFEFQIDNFMLYCSSKNLSKKTLASYEQALKLFAFFVQKEFEIAQVERVQTAHVRHYIKYLRERGKYTVSVAPDRDKFNYPDHRTDYNKPISVTTIANYVRIIKVFFNWLADVEREIKKNPTTAIENIKPDRKMKTTLSPGDLKRVFGAFDTTTFHGYRNLLVTRLLVDTGMRIGECLDLQPEHIDYEVRCP